MIGPLHLVLMFWLGGAVCFAAVIVVTSIISPEKVEELGLTLAQLVIGTFLWPLALVQAYRFGVQDRAWRERRRVRMPDPPPTPMVLDLTASGKPEALVLRDPDAVLPVPCESCARARMEWEARMQELYQEQPELCAPCKREWKEWVSRHAVKAE